MDFLFILFVFILIYSIFLLYSIILFLYFSVLNKKTAFLKDLIHIQNL